MVLCLWWNGLYLGARCTQTIHHDQNSHTKGASLGFWLAPKMIPIAWNGTVWTLVTSTLPKITLPVAVFFGRWGGAEISHGCILRHTDSHLLFQTWSKLVKDKCPKGRYIGGKKNTFWRHLTEPLGPFPQFFVPVCTVAPHLYSRFHPNLFRFRGVITEKNPCKAPKWF